MKLVGSAIALCAALAAHEAAQAAGEQVCNPGTETVECYLSGAAGEALICRLTAENAVLKAEVQGGSTEWGDVGKCGTDAIQKLKPAYDAAQRKAGKTPKLADALKRHQVQVLTLMRSLLPKAGERRGAYQARLGGLEDQLEKAANEVRVELP